MHSASGKNYIHDWLTPVAGLAILMLLHSIDYLAFHITAELFSAIVGALAFVIAANTWRFTHNRFLYIYGTGSLFVALNDLTHALTYKGMDLIPAFNNNANIATQFWLNGRYLEAVTLLLSVLALRKGIKWHPFPIFATFGIVTILLYTATFAGWFPAAWVPGHGLTPFKIGSEYLVMALYTVVLGALYLNRRALASDTYHLISIAVILMIFTELLFTLYGDIYGPLNMLGHYIKFLTFWLIYLAIVRSTLRQPFNFVSASAYAFDTIPSPVFVLNEYGRIRQANQAASKALGIPTATLEQKSIYDLPMSFPFDLLSGKTIRNLVESEDIFDDTIQMDDASQRYAMHLVPIDLADSDAAAVMTLTDITPTIHKQEGLERDNTQLLLTIREGNTILNGIDEGVVYTRERRILAVNKRLCEMFGRSEDELIGKSTRILYPDEESYRRVGNANYSALKQHKRIEMNTSFTSKDGSSFFARVVGQLVEPSSPDEGAIWLIEDVTEQHEMTEALRKSEGRYRSVVNALAEGVVLQEAGGEIAAWNPAAEQILGLAEETMKSRTSEDEAWNAIHEDGTPFPGETHPAMETLRTGKALRGIIMGLSQDDSGTRWLSINSEPLFHEEEKSPYAVVTTFEDITKSLADRKALRTAQKQLATVIAHFSSGILLEDDNRQLILANQAFCDIFGIDSPPESLTGIDCVEAADQAKPLFANPDKFLRRIKELLSTKKPVMNEEWQMSDGRTLERDYIPIFDGTQFVGHLWKYRDISEHKTIEKNLDNLAHTDALTGIANRRAFIEELNEEFERLIRYRSRPAAILMLDIDLFKNINDTYGHAAGDAVLRHFSGVLKKELRKVDTLGRVGGEEFAILLPETNLAGATQFAERLRHTVASAITPFGGNNLKITASIGVAILLPEDGNPNAALKRADAALYRAKAQGRNRVAAPEDFNFDQEES